MNVLNLTKITIAWEMHESGIPKAHIASKLKVNRETVHIWLKEIAEMGLLEFLDQYTKAKKGERSKRKIDGLLKVRIYKLREKYRDCCGQKIREFLFDEYGIALSTTTIYKVLGEKFKLRSKWKKNQIRGPIPEADRPREVIQMDTVDYRFRISRPYKKNEQSYIESFNRSLRKECLGWSKYRADELPNLTKELTDYLVYYHTKRPHMSLNMKTPNQFLKELVSDI